MRELTLTLRARPLLPAICTQLHAEARGHHTCEEEVTTLL